MSLTPLSLKPEAVKHGVASQVTRFLSRVISTFFVAYRRQDPSWTLSRGEPLTFFKFLQVSMKASPTVDELTITEWHEQYFGNTAPAAAAS